MADVVDVLTLAEGKATLKLSGTAQYDSQLPAWITAVSRMLDHKVGPIVRRTVTEELHDGGDGYLRTRLWPIAAITTITEYASTTGTVLTAETNLAKPDAGYLAERYDRDPTLFSGLIRRRAGGSRSRFAGGSSNIVVTYSAGRFVDTATVDERFKSAARLTLQNLWNSQRPNLAEVGEFEIPQSNWPRFAVPNAVKEMLADEWQDGPLVG